MELIIEILIVICVILIIFNFVSISISPNKLQSQAFLQTQTQTQSRTQSPQYMGGLLMPNSPQPMLSKNDTVLSNNLSLTDLSDDYHRQFYLPPY